MDIVDVGHGALPVGLVITEEKKGSRTTHGSPCCSVFARQIDHIVCEPERDALGRKISERNCLAVDGLTIAVLADELAVLSALTVNFHT